MSDSGCTTREALNNDREIFGHFRILPVHVHVNRVWLTCLQYYVRAKFSMCEFSIPASSLSLMFHSDVVASGFATVSFLSLGFALLRICTCVPSKCLHVDFLSCAGLDGELMIGAFFAGCGMSGVLTGVVKDEEVRSAYLRSV